MKRPPLGAELTVARLEGCDSPLFLLDELADETAVRNNGDAGNRLASKFAVPVAVEGRRPEEPPWELLTVDPAVVGREEAGRVRRGAGPIRAPFT